MSSLFFLRIWPPLVMSDLSVWSYRMYTLHARQYRNTLRKEDYAVFPWFHAAIFRGFRVQRGHFQVDASWASEMSFRPFKRACLTAWIEFLSFHSFWLALNWYTERIFQAINEKLNAQFSWRREVNYNDKGIIVTLTVGYFKKCVSFRLQ